MRVFDHIIPLEMGIGPVNIRPYRYPMKQRDVIEHLIQEMMDRGIIQNSSSPFFCISCCSEVVCSIPVTDKLMII